MTIDQNSGLVTWDNQALGSDWFWTQQVIVEKLVDGVLVAAVPIDFLLRITPQGENDPPQIATDPASPIEVSVGQLVEFDVIASDPNDGDTIELTSISLPSGSSMNPALPLSGPHAGITSTFNWTPAATGTFFATFTVSDQGGLQRQLTMTIDVIEVLTGSIIGTVTFNGSGFEGIDVTLTDDDLAVVLGATTDPDGSYSFDDLVAGDYLVSISEPLGTTVSPNASQDSELGAGATNVVDFTLTEAVVSNEARAIGYWKHQFRVSVTGNGNAHESAADLDGFIALIHTRYTSHFDHYEDIVGHQEWLDLMSVNRNGTMEDRALQQVAALLLNLVSGKLGQFMVVTDDGYTVGDVLTYASQLMQSSDGDDHELAKDLADMVNNKVLVPAGLVSGGGIVYSTIDDGDDFVFTLGSAYPNPVTSTTTIRFTLPESSHVRLTVYDVLGREVARIVDHSLQSGAHQVVFDAAQLAAGTYLYRLEAEGFTETRRMLLITR